MKEDIKQYVEHGRELRNLEYKQSMSWGEKTTQSKVIKAAMAMANLRDGGTIVFGMEERKTGDHGFDPKGMTKEDFESFNQDDVQEKVNRHADPYVNLSLAKLEDGERRFVVIRFQQFDDLPIVCKRDGDGFSEGQIFTRPFRKIETAQVRSQNEMREILAIATENSLRSFHERISRSGLSIEQPITDRDRFDAELENL